MNSELKPKWIEALRSGKYQQTSERLCEERYGDRSYCCLGVLADIINPDGWFKESEDFYVSWSGKDGILELAGLASVEELTNIGDVMQGELVSMNDNEGKSFVEIADWIEENL